MNKHTFETAVSQMNININLKPGFIILDTDLSVSTNQPMPLQLLLVGKSR